ncbi:hypothetical protein NI17_013215 [Thermobifida halotolerans]|uniref:Uncharacterized protein n=1 Tax=Thermobifida halotolerans TaxID=483545 RepID=A0AA97M293_9ACTN|nr:hypothetical protein [Thermobifida halotolerans]UOE17845.1 hypothetical protein NI17_013215 [Thermobifida halotolerans]
MSVPPYNPYSGEPKPPPPAREPAPTPRGTVPLYFLTGLLSVVVLVVLLVVGTGDPNIGLVRFLFFALFGLGCVLVAVPGGRARRALGCGLVAGTAGTVAAVVAVLAALA